MKKHLLSALLCLALLLSMVPSVMAATEEAIKINVLEEYSGKKVSIPSGWEVPTNTGAAFPSGVQFPFEYAQQSIFFGDAQSKYAMVNLKNTASGEYQSAYIDRQGNVEFFTPLSAHSITKAPVFYDGIGVAVKRGGENNRKLYVSYYNQDRAVIVDYAKEYEAMANPYSTGHLIVSEFYDGFAYVFKDVSDGYFYKPDGDEWDKLAYETKAISASYAKINTKGELISDWSKKQVIIPAEAWKGDQGISYDNYLHDSSAIKFHFAREMKIADYGGNGNTLLTYPATADQVVIKTAGEFRIVDVSAFGGAAQPKETTTYQSKAKLTNAGIGDLDYDVFEVTITNPTDKYDSGTVALVLASSQATVHFVDYDLAPNESKVYTVSVTGHIGNTSRAPYVILNSGWGAYLNADIITFSDDEDLDAYRAAVPYEANEKYYGYFIGLGYVVCYGQPGDDWLKNYTGISRKTQPYQYPDITHSICKP